MASQPPHLLQRGAPGAGNGAGAGLSRRMQAIHPLLQPPQLVAQCLDVGLLLSPAAGKTEAEAEISSERVCVCAPLCADLGMEP